MSAQIEDRVFLFGDNLDVTAANGVLAVAFGGSGGSAKDFGFTGVGIFNSIDDHTTASIGGRAVVELGGDATIGATDTTYLITVAGSLTRAEKVGIGASVGWNQVSRVTQAYVGNAADDTVFAPGGSLQVGGALDISAATAGFLGAFAVAGATASNDKQADQQTAAAAAVGFAHNEVADTTNAFIFHAKITAVGTIALTATNGTIMEALAIGGALSRGNVNSVALAGAGATNTVNDHTQTFIKDSNNTNAADLRGVASTAGAVTLTTTDSTQVYAHAGAVSIAWNQNTNNSTATRSLSIGVSVAIDQVGGIGHSVLAFIDNAVVTAAGDILLAATNNSRYDALAVGGSVSSAAGGSLSGTALAGAAAGAYASNVVNTTVSAVVSGGSVVRSLGGVFGALAMLLGSLLRSDAFGIAVAYAASRRPNSSTGALAIGVGIAINKVKNTVEASVDASTVEANGNVTLTATETGNISALGIGVAVSVAAPEGPVRSRARDRRR